MDPTACYERFCTALARGNFDGAEAAAADLLRWLTMAGGPPRQVPVDNVERLIDMLARIAPHAMADAMNR
jgi:hypothetical protein